MILLLLLLFVLLPPAVLNPPTLQPLLTRCCYCCCYCPPQSVHACHPALQPLLLSNVLLTGGAVRCPGLVARYSQELRPLVLQEHELQVFVPPVGVGSCSAGMCGWL